MIFRGIIHAHSTHSYDGKLSLLELKALLKDKGLSFACMTEHTDQLTHEAAAVFMAECRELSDETFVFVPGFEVPYRNAHVLYIGAEYFVTSEAKTGADLEAWRRCSPLVVLAHPVRNRFVVDAALLATIDGVEIWNQQYEGKVAPRTRSVTLLNSLRQQKPLLATGGTDFHRAEHLGSPYTTLELDVFNKEAIVSALRKGIYSFGNSTYSIAAMEYWVPSLATKLQSGASCAVISIGKTVNRTLARFGVRLPKPLVRVIRGRV